MSELVNLDHGQSHNEVHHGCVKLQTQIGRTYVEGCREEALGNCCQSHGIVEAILLRKTSLLLAVLPRWLLLEVARLNPHKKHEAKAEPDVAKVAVDVIECFEYPPGPGTAVVEVAGL